MEMPSLWPQRGGLQMKVFLKRDPDKNWLLWWGTSPETIRYPIPEKRVQAALDPEPQSLDQRLAKYRERLNRVYRGEVVEFENGSYNREMKTLTLKTNGGK
jgi:hypothetical protein